MTGVRSSGAPAGRRRLRAYPTIGACGLDCGLCPRYYTVGSSRCPGCGGPGFLGKHPSCSFITCCVKKRGLEACGQCPELPCAKFKSEEEYQQRESSSYPPDRKLLANLRFMGGKGIEEFIRRQQERIGLLETMIDGYDDGRSRSFFCRAAALLDPEALKECLQKARKATTGGETSNRTDRAKVLRGILAKVALDEGVELTRKRQGAPPRERAS
jgi:hypothetical protein